MRQLILIFLVILVGFAISPQTDVDAQANLLTNPGFEPPYDVGQRGLANGWSAQTAEGTPDYYQEQYGSLYSGQRSQAILCNLVCKAAVYQVVSGIPVGSKVRASGYASLYVAGPGSTHEQMKGTWSTINIAIDPNGGTNIGDADVVWGSYINTESGHEAGDTGWAVDYTAIAAEAVTTGPNVTVFFYVTQTWPATEHRMFFDNASLTVLEQGTGGTGTDGGGTTGGDAPAPTSPPIVSSFAQPQEAQADGSIIHTVKANETVYAIAVAYGVTAQQILDLNDIGDGRFIYQGQQLLIRPATSSSDDIITDGGTTEDPTDVPTQVAVQATDVPVEPTDVPPTATSVPTATPIPPTETPAPTSTPLPDAPVVTQDSGDTDLSGATSVCVAMFEDTNMNRIMEDGESYLAGGMITLSQNGNSVETIVTDNSPDPICFEGLDIGEYVVIGSAPAGYGLTTPDQLRLRVRPGSPLDVMFGAAEGVEVAVAPPADVNPLTPATTDPASPEDDDAKLLQYLGLIVFGLAGLSLVGGLGIALVMRRG